MKNQHRSQGRDRSPAQSHARRLVLEEGTLCRKRVLGLRADRGRKRHIHPEAREAEGSGRGRGSSREKPTADLDGISLRPRPRCPVGPRPVATHGAKRVRRGVCVETGVVAKAQRAKSTSPDASSTSRLATKTSASLEGEIPRLCGDETHAGSIKPRCTHRYGRASNTPTTGF